MIPGSESTDVKPASQQTTPPGRIHHFIHAIILLASISACNKVTRGGEIRETLTRGWFDAGPPSQTAGQHRTNLGPVFRVFRDAVRGDWTWVGVRKRGSWTGGSIIKSRAVGYLVAIIPSSFIYSFISLPAPSPP